MKRMKNIVIIACLCLMISCAALGETLSLNGTVGTSRTSECYAPVGGLVESVLAAPGQKVTAGEALLTLRTTKVYASQSGTVTGIFAQPGDDAETAAARYGAVLYMESESKYTLSASVDNAYDTTAAQYVRVGEKVYLRCYSDGQHKGEGTITAASGTDYTVEITQGDFLLGESVTVYRQSTYKAADRIGRGSVSRTDPIAVTGAGGIVSIAVENGQTVQRGELLFETLDGAFDGLVMTGNQILAGTDGTVAQLSAAQGDTLTKGALVAVIYPADAMRVEAVVGEYDLGLLQTGDQVNVELLWNQDAEVVYPGTVDMISAVAEESEEEGEAQYKVYVGFTPDESTRYGMRALVSTLE